MKYVLLAAAGGAIGSAARYLAVEAATKAFGPAFPYGTLIVNIAGCFAMGLLVELLAQRLNGSPEMRVFLATGILGGFTTFSAFSLDFVMLAERKAHDLALIYAFGSVGLSLAAIYGGLALGRAVWS